MEERYRFEDILSEIGSSERIKLLHDSSIKSLLENKTIANHFEGKEDKLRALCSQVFDDLNEELASLINKFKETTSKYASNPNYSGEELKSDFHNLFELHFQEVLSNCVMNAFSIIPEGM